MRLDQLIGVRDQREGGAHGICDGDFEVALRFLADHLRLALRQFEPLRQQQGGRVAVHVVYIDLLLREAGEIPPDDLRMAYFQISGPAQHMIDRVILWFTADHGVADITKSRHIGQYNGGIGITAHIQVLSDQLVHRAGEQGAQLDQLIHLGICAVQLPFRYGLAADAHPVSQRFLGHAISHLSQKLQVLSETHPRSLLIVDDLIIIFTERAIHQAARSLLHHAAP
ncbi:hypothetical protein SDC9_170748 [bioreactor metagenome]|uniref:Uncharacterized protein n=1 Tax=bioreactor metagenome TaxID=1076179 RepID=A0A645GBD9_9ZZZZ